MEFGLLSTAELETTDLSLPADSPFTHEILAAHKTEGEPKIYVGCAKWGRKEWVGKIYPKGTKEVKFLNHYVKHFNSIELNATHYKIHDTSTIAGWSAKADDRDFKFCPKVPQSISHFSDLISPKPQLQTNEFLKGIRAFGNHLGPVFLQLSDRFSPAKKENLFSYLKSLPSDINFFVEVRNPAWFSDVQIRDEFFQALRQFKMGAVITDTAGRRDCVHMALTTPVAFIRFVGNNLHPTDYPRVDEWVKRLKIWLDNGLKELYFFMHHSEETYSPDLTAYVVDEMNKHFKTHLIKPMFVDGFQPGAPKS